MVEHSHGRGEVPGSIPGLGSENLVLYPVSRSGSGGIESRERRADIVQWQNTTFVK